MPAKPRKLEQPLAIEYLRKLFEKMHMTVDLSKPETMRIIPHMYSDKPQVALEFTGPLLRWASKLLG